MLYGINNNNNDNLINTQLKEQSEVSTVTNPITQGSNPYTKAESGYLVDETSISREAFYLYQKEIDIKNFTKIAANTEEDPPKMQELFSKGVLDPFEAANTDKLINNDKLLKDLNVSF